MKFSLIQIYKTNPDGTINGVWLQNHIGTIETAKQRALATEKANSNIFEVGVVEELSYTPDYSIRYSLKRLDKR